MHPQGYSGDPIYVPIDPSSAQVQPPPPPPPASLSPPSSSVNGNHRTSPKSDDSQMNSSANLQKVQEFLTENGGRPLNHVELAGLVHLLQSSVEGRRFCFGWMLVYLAFYTSTR